MKISTKTLSSLLVVTAAASSLPGISRICNKRGLRESRFDRIMQRHDRKGELRAAVLGVSPPEFKEIEHAQSFETALKGRGFLSERAYRLALMGKIKDELHYRGWSSKKIDQHIMTRFSRVA